MKFSPIDLERFIAALALNGVQEATVPLRVYYLLSQVHPPERTGHDGEGPYLDLVGGAVRIRPAYQQGAQVFQSEEAIATYVEKAVKDVSGTNG